MTAVTIAAFIRVFYFPRLRMRQQVSQLLDTSCVVVVFALCAVNVTERPFDSCIQQTNVLRPCPGCSVRPVGRTKCTARSRHASS